jgi:hypothetical protein
MYECGMRAREQRRDCRENRDPLDGKMISPLVSKVKRFRKWLIAFKKSDGAGMVAFLVARNHSQTSCSPA